MSMKRILLVALVVLAQSCSRTSTLPGTGESGAKIIPGVYTNGKYSNKLFSFDYPVTWIVKATDEFSQLFVVAKYEALTSNSGNNLNLVVVAEDSSTVAAREIMSYNDFLEAFIKSQASKSGVETSAIYEPLVVNGINLLRSNYKIEAGGQIFEQTHYNFRAGGYYIALVMTTKMGTKPIEFSQIIQSLKLAK